MASPGFEHAYVATNGVTLHVVRAGPEDGPLVVLLHGFPEFWYAWRHYISALSAAGYRVLAPDQRGYNLSDKPLRVSDYALDTLAADVAGLIEAEGRKKAFVVGHDWGAAVTWWLAAHHPDRVERAAVLNVPHPEVMRARLLGGSPTQILRSWYMFYFQIPWLPERAFAQDGGRRQFARITSIGRKHAFAPGDEAAYLAAWAQPDAPRAMIDWYRAAARWAFGPREAVPRITAPVHVLWGCQDKLLDAAMVEPSLALCDEARVTWFEDATHWVLHEERDTIIAQLLGDFV